MLRWMSSWEEAAKRPWRTVITVSLSGLVAGGLYGYFRFGDSVGIGVALGSGVALILGTMTLKTVHDPARVAELTERKARGLSATALRSAAVRPALPFVALGIATAAGAAFHSLTVFVITLAA